MREDQEIKSVSTSDMSNSERLSHNRTETMKNIASYAQSIMPDVLGGKVDSDIKERTKEKIDALLRSAADAVNDKKYSSAIDKLEEAKDLASGIIWKKYVEYKHKDGSIDLIRDATMQEHIGEDKAAQEHIITLMRNLEVLRGAEELMKTTKKGEKNVQKNDFLLNIKSSKGKSIDEADKEEEKKWSKSIKETRIFKCKQELVAAIRNSTSAHTEGGYAFAEPEYILKIRDAVKHESGIKNKSAKIDWVRKNVAIEDRQYHVTTIIKQKDKDGKDVLASDSSVMMLGFSKAQVGIYTHIDNAHGKKVDYRPSGIEEDESMVKIASRYNDMQKYKRKIVSNSASHIYSQDKVVPTLAKGFDCLKNPRCDVIALHQEFRLPNKPPQIKSSQIAQSYAIDGTQNSTKSKIDQLKGFFEDGQKINITLLGSPRIILGIPNFFSKSRIIYNVLKDGLKEDKNLSVDSISLQSDRAFVVDDLADFKKTLRDTGGAIKANCKKEIEKTRVNLKVLNKSMRGFPRDSDKRKKISTEIDALNAKIGYLSDIAVVMDYVKYSRPINNLRIANRLLSKIDENLGYEGMPSTTDLSNLLNAKRLVKGIHYKSVDKNYEGEDKEQRSSVAAIKPIVMDIASKVSKEESKKTVDVMTSIYPGRVSLVSLRAAHQSITAALGLKPLEKESNAIIESNLKTQLNSGHIKHIANSRGVHGINGINKKDVKGILAHDDPIYANLVDTEGTGNTLDSGNKAYRILSKIATKSKNFINWFRNDGESILIKILRCAIALVLWPVKVLATGVVDLYKFTRDWITGKEQQLEAERFLCSGLPTIVKREGLSHDVGQLIDSLSVSHDKSTQDNYPEKNNPFEEDKNKMPLKVNSYPEKNNPFEEDKNKMPLKVNSYPEKNNPFEEDKNQMSIKNSSKNSKVNTKYPDKLDPFSDKTPSKATSKESQESEKQVKHKQLGSWTSTVNNDTKSDNLSR